VDDVIASLLAAGMIDSERVDHETAILRLSPVGYTIAASLRDNMGYANAIPWSLRLP
jgi:hypothetical protein